MANNFRIGNNNVTQDNATNDMNKYLTRYNSARSNILLVVILTAVNLFMIIGNTGTYFLFSATVPYFIVDLAMYLCGMYPAETYEALGETFAFLPESLFTGAVVIAVLIIIVYLVCFFASKKQRFGWLIAALVMFAIDTVAMLLCYGFDPSMILDIVFHIWVVVSLFRGVMAYFSLSKLPTESVNIDGFPSEGGAEGEEDEDSENGYDTAARDLPDSKILRSADMTVKFKVLAEAELYGHKVVYRRVKKTNELVIDSYVYAEYTALFELDHVLSANVDGHAFAAGLRNGSVSYITVDGRTALEKMRLI